MELCGDGYCYRVPDLATVLLSGKPCSDREIVQYRIGICWSHRQRIGVGSVLRNRNNFTVFVPEGKAGVRRGDRATGN